MNHCLITHTFILIFNCIVWTDNSRKRESYITTSNWCIHNCHWSDISDSYAHSFVNGDFPYFRRKLINFFIGLHGLSGKKSLLVCVFVCVFVCVCLCVCVCVCL